RPGATGENRVNLEARKLRCELGEQSGLGVSRSMLECNIPFLGVSGLTQPLYECVPVGRRRRRSIGWSCDSEVPDPVAHRLLRACGERAGRRAADNGDE